MTEQSQGPYFKLRVAEVIDETADAKSIVFEIPQDLQERFAYESGQFLTFRTKVGDQRLVRCYSLASSPVTDSAHKVAVKRIDEGRVSNWMNDNVVAGDELEVMPPAGNFVLQAERTTPIVLFGGGSGITPVISILKTAIATTQRPIKLVYANRDEDQVIFRAELDALVAAHEDRLEIVHRLDAVHGFVDVGRVVEEVGDRRDADFYICGPGPFMDVVEAGLEGLKIDAAQIFIERFISEPDEGDLLEAVEAAEAAAAGEGVKVTIKLDGAETEILVADGETVLAAARREGLKPPFACEEAYCGCCMARVTAGDIEMLMNDGGIDQKQIDDGWILTCQGVPKGNAKVEYPD